jgi:hypothetical protein
MAIEAPFPNVDEGLLPSVTAIYHLHAGLSLRVPVRCTPFQAYKQRGPLQPTMQCNSTGAERRTEERRREQRKGMQPLENTNRPNGEVDQRWAIVIGNKDEWAPRPGALCYDLEPFYFFCFTMSSFFSIAFFVCCLLSFTMMMGT